MNEKIFILPLNDPKTREALVTGRLSGRRVVAREVIEPVRENKLNETGILFEFFDDKIIRPSSLHVWLQTIRAFSLTATGTPCVAVLVLSLVRGDSIYGWTGLSALLGVLFLQVAINLFNDVEDYRRLIDLPGTLGGSGVIQNGWWTPSELKKIAWLSLTVGSFLGLPAVFHEPLILLPIGLLGAVGVLFYSGRKAGLKYRALGDLAVWILCGPLLTLGFSLAISRTWSAGVLSMGAFFGFLASALLHVNNLQDMKLDKARGVKTYAISLGFKGSLKFLVFLYAGAFVSLVVAVCARELPLFSVAGAIVSSALAFPWLKKVYCALGPESSLLSNCRIKAAQIHLLGGVSLIFGLVSGWLIG
jgi:1,4-dihydroxy-2-naphthoate octaprenyltransferase